MLCRWIKALAADMRVVRHLAVGTHAMETEELHDLEALKNQKA